MISELIKLLMKECKLDQSQLADLMGVKIQRVRNLSAGLVQKLTREESEALVKKLNVRPGYLVTGQLPLFQTSGEQAFQQGLDTVALATRQAVAAGLTPGQADVYQRLMLASKMGDFATLKRLVISLSVDENELLENYRRCTPTGRSALLTSSAEMAAALLRPSAHEFGPDEQAKPAKPGERASAHGFGPDVGSTSQPRFIGPDEAAETDEAANNKRGKKK